MKSYVEFTVNVIIYVDVQLTMIALQLSFVYDDGVTALICISLY